MCSSGSMHWTISSTRGSATIRVMWSTGRACGWPSGVRIASTALNNIDRLNSSSSISLYLQEASRKTDFRWMEMKNKMIKDCLQLLRQEMWVRLTDIHFNSSEGYAFPLWHSWDLLTSFHLWEQSLRATIIPFFPSLLNLKKYSKKGNTLLKYRSILTNTGD